MIVKNLQGGVAEAAFGQVEDALEGKIVGWLRGAAQIGERIAARRRRVESWPADHPVRQAKGDKPLLEFAHLERRADKNGNLVEGMALALNLLDLFANHAGFFLRIPDPGDGWFLASLAIGEEGFSEPPLVMRDQARRDAEDMPGRAIITLQADDFRARKIGLEAQDVIDLG